MRTVELFNKSIPVRETDCRSVIYNNIDKFQNENRLNLFIQVDNRCNAKCKFCEWNGLDVGFNLSKLEYIIKYLSERVTLGKLNFTGGEPTYDLVKFDEIVSCVSDSINHSLKPEITLNTNGLHLLDMLKYSSLLDYIGLSRHHYDNHINEEVFGNTGVASSELIKEFQSAVDNKSLIQLRCNVIKGLIENSDEVLKYLHHAIDCGIIDCGFVTLMPVNEYCKSHQIDFYNLLSSISNKIKVDGFERFENQKKVCECGNYVWTDGLGHFCKFYSRYFNHCDMNDGQLVYDGNNLRLGFGGEIIF